MGLYISNSLSWGIHQDHILFKKYIYMLKYIPPTYITYVMLYFDLTTRKLRFHCLYNKTVLLTNIYIVLYRLVSNKHRFR